MKEKGQMRIFIIVLLLMMSAGCKQKAEWQGSLKSMLVSQPERFGTVMRNPEKYRVQIMQNKCEYRSVWMLVSV